MNKKGFAISGIIYIILILFLALTIGILGLLGNRKMILDSFKNKVVSKLNDEILTAGENWNFIYTGNEQLFAAPYSGIYKLEVWGAQGGSTNSRNGGYGGYSTGTIYLNQGEKIYINVGGKGVLTSSGVADGGYNGGGEAYGGICSGGQRYSASGGGATHMAIVSGLLSSLEGNRSAILIVAGGGGGAYESNSGNGGHAGGFNGNSVVWSGGRSNYPGGGTQSSGGLGGNNYNNELPGSGTFGHGGYLSNPSMCNETAGGGSGYYGGGSSKFTGAAGGSGYIGNVKLNNKEMYCYQCEQSNEMFSKTTSTNNVSELPITNYAKQGNGAARITVLSQ